MAAGKLISMPLFFLKKKREIFFTLLFLYSYIIALLKIISLSIMALRTHHLSQPSQFYCLGGDIFHPSL